VTVESRSDSGHHGEGASGVVSKSFPCETDNLAEWFPVAFSPRASDGTSKEIFG
jgi:hypothetical protein